MTFVTSNQLNAELIFKKVENGLDVYEVYKDRSGEFSNYGYVSGSIVENALKMLSKVLVINSIGATEAKNFLN